MSHDTHDTHGHHHAPANEKPVIAFKAAFYFVLIIAGLFVAAMGFVKAMSHDESGHGGGHSAQHTEATGGHEAHGAHEMKGGSLEGAEHTNPAQETEHGGEGEHEHHEAPAEHH